MSENSPSSTRTPRLLVRLMTAIFIACRHLVVDKKRFGLNILGLGVAAMLVLFMQGVVEWINVSTTAYLDHVNSDLLVTSSGIDDLLFSQTAIPQNVASEISQMQGVASVTPILAINGTLSTGKPLIVFVVGYPTDKEFGAWSLDSGRNPSARDEAVLDRGMAVDNNIHIGDDIKLLGHSIHVVGLSKGTNAAGSFFVFLPIETAQDIAGSQIVSHMFVKLDSGVSRGEVMSQINNIPGLHTVSKDKIATNDRDMMNESFSQPVEIMVAICLGVGLLIAMIVLYTATVERARDLAVLKAVGANGKFLILVSVIQSILLSVNGLIAGLLLTEGLIWGFATFRPVIESYLNWQLIGEISVLLLIVNLVALIFPARFLLRVDPQEVFKA